MKTLPQELSARFPGLKEMPDLEELIRYDNPDTYALDEQGQVIGLNLCSKKLTDAEAAFIWNLPHLKALNLSENELTSVVIPAEMKALRFLNLSENARLKKLTFAEGLPNLEEANLRQCALGTLAIPPGMDALHTLDLEKNLLTEFVFQGDCPSLVHLYLSENQLASLTLPEGLHRLADMHLSNNRLENLRFRSGLPNLNTLNLRDNQLRELSLPPGFDSLETLYLEKNLIASIDFLKKLDQLKNLDLRNNQITDLSPLLPLIRKGVQVRWESRSDIAVKDNPLSIPPPEIVARGNEAILSFFREREAQGTDTLYEAKLLVVGEGRAGKTSLIRRLFFPKLPLPEEKDTTKGIDIHRYEFPGKNGKPFRMNVWDFGGQQIYHATHQFFLTKRSLYILLDDTSKDHKNVQDEGFKYWLEVIDLLGDHSPVLIFQNEKGGRSKAIDIPGIKGRFDNVKDVYGGNLDLLNSADNVREAIFLHIQQLPHIGQSLPKKWIDIRREIENLAVQKPFIPQEEYFQIYGAYLAFDEKKALELSQYFHDLGVFLHFQEDELLAETVILQNSWATEAVFKVLDDEIVKSKLGRFNAQDCKRIWADSVYKGMHVQLRALMMKFELCYQLPDAQSATWLTPQMLPPSKPESLKDWGKAGDLELRYQYEFLPQGLINRLMVRKHRLVKRPELSWKNGVLFEREDNQLLVQLSEKGDVIILRARGAERKELISVISDDLEALNESFQGLSEKVNKKIPCICTKCLKSPDPEFYSYKRLVQRKKDNKIELECPLSYETVSVLALLDGFEVDLKKPLNEPPTHVIADIEGMKKTLNTLIDKKNNLSQALAKASDESKKFTLQKEIEELESEIQKLRGKIKQLEN